MDELKKTIDLRQVEIDQLLRKLQAGQDPDERGKLQSQIAKLQSELRVHVETERQSLQKRELQIQAEVYKEIQAIVKQLAKERGLKLVVVRPRGSLESQDAGELNRTLNQLVIYEEEGLDITTDVLKALEAKDAEEK
jgi:Skp family chaperone for outer membrane proteins